MERPSLQFSAAQESALKPLLKNTYWPRGGYWNLGSARRFMLPLTDYVKPQDKFLDLGCGLKPLYKPFVETLNANWYGTDLHTEEEVGLSTYKAAGDESIPFSDAFFDVIMLFHVVEHFTNPEAMFIEMNRCMKPGGIVGGACAFHEFEHGSFFHLTHRGIEVLLQRHGFEVLSIVPSEHSGWMLEGQRFFGGTGSIDKSSPKAFLRSATLCNLNWLPFLICNFLEFIRRNNPLWGRYYTPAKDAASVYFYARKLP